MIRLTRGSLVKGYIHEQVKEGTNLLNASATRNPAYKLKKVDEFSDQYEAAFEDYKRQHRALLKVTVYNEMLEENPENPKLKAKMETAQADFETVSARIESMTCDMEKCRYYKIEELIDRGYFNDPVIMQYFDWKNVLEKPKDKRCIIKGDGKSDVPKVIPIDIKASEVGSIVVELESVDGAKQSAVKYCTIGDLPKDGEALAKVWTNLSLIDKLASAAGIVREKREFGFLSWENKIQFLEVIEEKLARLKKKVEEAGKEELDASREYAVLEFRALTSARRVVKLLLDPHWLFINEEFRDIVVILFEKSMTELVKFGAENGFHHATEMEFPKPREQRFEIHQPSSLVKNRKFLSETEFAFSVAAILIDNPKNAIYTLRKHEPQYVNIDFIESSHIRLLANMVEQSISYSKIFAETMRIRKLLNEARKQKDEFLVQWYGLQLNFLERFKDAFQGKNRNVLEDELWKHDDGVKELNEAMKALMEFQNERPLLIGNLRDQE